MKIGIYIEVLKSSEKTGIGGYVEGLINSLSKEAKHHELILYYQCPFFGKKPQICLNLTDNVKLRPIFFPTKLLQSRPRLWWDYYLPWIAENDKIDIFHGPNHFIPSRGKFKKIVTIHDIAYFYMNVHGSGMDRVLKIWTLKSFHFADKVICVSNSTARDCAKEGLNFNKISVVYQGFESNFEQLKLNNKEVKNVIRSLNLPKKCVLFLGSIQPRKNISMLILAFSEIADKIPHNLVLAGGPGSSQKDMTDLVAALSLGERISFTGYINDEQRVALYQHSELFVYPSRYEGFGLVLLEAMSFGLPVLTCNNSSLPEVVKDESMLVETDDVGALATKMLAILIGNQSLRKNMIQYGYQRCKIFNWQKSALDTLHVYESLLPPRDKV
nr:glycosyltransferase family 1 protein [uncultured Glaciecola sp.]